MDSAWAQFLAGTVKLHRLHTSFLKLLLFATLVCVCVHLEPSAAWPDRFFLRRGVIAFNISTLHKKGSGSLPLAYLCQPPSGMLGANFLPIKHKCLYILLQVMIYVHNNEFSMQGSGNQILLCFLWSRFREVLYDVIVKEIIRKETVMNSEISATTRCAITGSESVV